MNDDYGIKSPLSKKTPDLTMEPLTPGRPLKDEIVDVKPTEAELPSEVPKLKQQLSAIGWATSKNLSRFHTVTSNKISAEGYKEH